MFTKIATISKTLLGRRIYMSQVISVAGYAPSIDYCPRCGSGEIYQSMEMEQLSAKIAVLNATLSTGITAKSF